MAFANIAPETSIWHNMGLKYLLAQSDVPAEASLLKQTDIYYAQARPAMPAARTQAQQTEPQKEIVIPQRPRQAPTTRQQGKPAPATEAPSWTPLPIDMWPEPWRDLLQRTKKGKISWTYWLLGQDLGGTGDETDNTGRKTRSAFLGKLIRDLALPPGSHTFWPVCLPDADHKLVGNKDIFWSAMPKLASRATIIFGSEAAKLLLPEENLKPSLHMRKYGQLIWVLWDLDGLTAHPGKYEMLLTFLKSALSPFFSK